MSASMCVEAEGVPWKHKRAVGKETWSFCILFNRKQRVGTHQADWASHKDLSVTKNGCRGNNLDLKQGGNMTKTELSLPGEAIALVFAS